jgi:DNA-binding MarR family transcriptional regulator
MSSRENTSTAEAPLDQGPMPDLVGYNCKRAFIAIDPFSDERMAGYQLRSTDFALLNLLYFNPEVSQKQAASGIHVSAPNLAPILDRLESRGLVHRRRHPDDKRFQALSLTAEGRRLYVKAEKTALEIEHEATCMLSTSERRQLVALLRKIYLA